MNREELINKTHLASSIEQILLVYGPYKTENEIMYYHASYLEKKDGKFQEVFFLDDARCGKNGLTEYKVSGDNKTPIGAYRLTESFGFHDFLHTDMVYHHINENSYWGDDTKEWGEYANRYYEGDSPVDTKEKLDAYSQYEYGFNIGYNYDEVVYGKGSAIFLHCHGKANTAGCVSLPKEYMQKLMGVIKKNAVIIIIRNLEDIRQY